MKRFLALCTVLFIAFLPAIKAQEADTTRLITRATSYGIGLANVLDTYLSPQSYNGLDLRFTRENVKATRWGSGRFSSQTFFQGDCSLTHNHADNNNTLYMLANWNYAIHYNLLSLPHHLRLQVGGVGDLNGGFVYNMRNGNNPAQARVYGSLDASAAVHWDVRIFRAPVHFRYQLNVPVMGLMFMPQYGETYYEIFSLGNHDGIVHFTSFHNAPSLRHILSADIPVRRSKLRISYLWDGQQANLAGIKTHAYSHVFTLGFVQEYYKVKRGQKGGHRK